MKFKAVKSFRLGTTTFGRGKLVDVSDVIAKDLIKRGLAAEEGSALEKQLERPAESERAKAKPLKAGSHRRDEQTATTGRAADRKED